MMHAITFGTYHHSVAEPWCDAAESSSMTVVKGDLE